MTITRTFAYTGGWASYTVPAGVTTVHIDAMGAGASGSKGGRVQGSFSVTPGQIIYVACGQAGRAGGTGSTHGQAGGLATYSGGGAGGDGYNHPGGYSGGGCTQVRVGSTSGTIKAIAGGAGGDSGDGHAGGAGGGLTGGSSSGDYPASGGTQAAGGSGGHNSSRTRLDGHDGSDNGPGSGGAGGDTGGLDGYGGGGGGGGYRAGGGGTGSSDGYQGGSGGGGGASYSGALTGAVNTLGGGTTGNGSVVLTHEDPNVKPNIPTSVSPTAGAFTKSAGSLTVSAVVSDPDGGTVRALFRYSTDPAFATYTDKYSTYVTSGSTATLVLTGLTQNKHYYMRVYAQDPSAAFSAGYASTNFYTNRPPNAPVLTTPTDGSAGLAANDNDFAWTFSDPDPSDTQGGAVMSYRKHGTADNWATIALTGAGTIITVPANTFDPSTDYDWNIQTKDAGGLWGPASATRVFHASGPVGTPVVTSPAPLAVVQHDDDLPVNWTFVDPDVGDTQTRADVRWSIKDAAVWSEVDHAATTGFTYSIAGGNLARDLQYEIQVRTYDSSNNASPWSASVVVQVIDTPRTPTQIDPSNASIVTTSTPALTATRPVPPAWQPLKFEWELAADAGFTTEVISFVQDDDMLAIGASSTSTLPATTPVNQVHPWYVRVRSLDTFGGVSAWSDSISFSARHAPSPINLLPTGLAYEAISPASRFSWTFSSTSGASHQTAYQIIIQKNDGTAFHDTGKVSSTQQFSDIDLTTIPVDTVMRWRLKVWDEDDVASTFTPFQLFICGYAPTFTITPVNGATVANGSPEVTWSDLVIGGTRIMASWTVEFNLLLDGSTVYSASGDTPSTRSFTPPHTILLNDQDYSVTVTIVDSVGLTTAVTSFFHTSYDSPDVLAYLVDISQIDTLGYVIIDWSGSIPDAKLTKWRVYRKAVGAADWTLLAEIPNQLTTEYHDWLFNSGTNYLYTVTQSADRSGAEVESPLGFNATYVPRRNNLARNPVAGINASLWEGVAGTGGSVTAVTRQTDGGALSGTYASITWTGATTNVSGGLGQSTDAGSVLPGDTITGSAYVRPSKVQGMVARIQWLNAAGTVIATTISDTIEVTQDVWTRLEVTAVAPALTDHVRFTCIAADGDPSSSLWAIGDKLDVDNMLISTTDQLWDWFDGSTAGGHWDGDVDLSTSYIEQITVPEAEQWLVISSNYWIIDPVAEDANTMLPNATAAAITDSYETADYTIIGRGRKVDYGTHLGYSGEIDCQVRGYDGTPALTRAKLEYLKALQDTYYIRSPFGDLFQAALGDMVFTPIAGTGTTVMYDISVPFEQVA